MSIQWAGLGPELLLRLDRERGEPLRSQLERELREAIRSQRLGAGERLPSSRSMARELGVSRGLVQECYSQLLAEGYLTARTGSATRVAATASDRPASMLATPAAARPAIDFVPGRPDLMSFPRNDWAWASRVALRLATPGDIGYGNAAGTPRLREVLASYLGRVRGAAADPERIIICAGFAQGFNLIIRALAEQGVQRVAFEEPGHPDHNATAERWGMESVPVPVDEHGIDVDALEATGARAALLTPAHQYPTGVVLSPARRQRLIEWAERSDATIVEDDYDAEFRYDREPVGALQGLAPGRVATIGTVSKSLAPALRLGWVVCPPRLREPMAGQKRLDDRGSPALDQLALASLVESGRYDKHLRRMRGVYGGRRRVLMESLGTYAPEVELRGLEAGLHAVGHLPPSLEEREVVAAARERSVGLHPMSRNRASGATRPPQLVFGFGDTSEAAIQRGIATVGDLLRGT